MFTYHLNYFFLSCCCLLFLSCLSCRSFLSCARAFFLPFRVPFFPFFPFYHCFPFFPFFLSFFFLLLLVVPCRKSKAPAPPLFIGTSRRFKVVTDIQGFAKTNRCLEPSGRVASTVTHTLPVQRTAPPGVFDVWSWGSTGQEDPRPRARRRASAPRLALGRRCPRGQKVPPRRRLTASPRCSGTPRTRPRARPAGGAFYNHPASRCRRLESSCVNPRRASFGFGFCECAVTWLKLGALDLTSSRRASSCGGTKPVAIDGAFVASFAACAPTGRADYARRLNVRTLRFYRDGGNVCTWSL